MLHVNRVRRQGLFGFQLAIMGFVTGCAIGLVLGLNIDTLGIAPHGHGLDVSPLWLAPGFALIGYVLGRNRDHVAAAKRRAF